MSQNVAKIEVVGYFDSVDKAYSFTDEKTGEIITGLALLIHHTQKKEVDIGGLKQSLPVNSPIIVSIPKERVSEVFKDLPNRFGKEVSISCDGIRVSKNEAVFDFAGFVDSKPASKN